MGAECSLLYDTRPLVVNPDLAKLVGLEEALILHQIHYWVKINQTARKQHKSGFYWTYNTYNKWAEQFPFWSVSTIKRIIKRLEEKKLVIVGRFNKLNTDRTKWYRLNHGELIRLSRLGQNGTLESAKMEPPRCQVDPIDEATESVKLTPPIPETNKQRLTTENSVAETSSEKKPRAHSRPIFAAMQNELGYPDQTQIDPIPNYGKEAKAIDRMLKRGYTESAILETWRKKVRKRGEFVSMVYVNEDIGKPDRPKQAAFNLPDTADLAAAAKERGLVK